MGLQKMLAALGRNTRMIGYGCMGISEFYGPTPAKTDAIELIRKAYHDYNVVFYDTADMYGNGLSEAILGEAVAGFRERIIIGTKCGILRKDREIGRGVTAEVINTPSYIKEACNQSLRRLNTDYIDIYYLHRYNGTTEIEDIMLAMKELLDEGKIRSVGLSEVNPSIIRRAHSVIGANLVAVQTEYSFNTREPVADILATCRELDITIIPYSPISRGFLSGAIRNNMTFKSSDVYDYRSVVPRFADGNFERNLRLVDAMKEFAQKKGATSAQLALAWLLAQGEDIIPIPGTSKLEHLRENIQAENIYLSREEIQELEALYSANPQEGLRMPEEERKAFDLV